MQIDWKKIFNRPTLTIILIIVLLGIGTYIAMNVKLYALSQAAIQLIENINTTTITEK